MFGWLRNFWRFNGIVVQSIGIANAVHAVMKVRSPQGAIAWVVALLTFPYMAVPFYWVFGRSKFLGYQKSDRTKDRNLADTAREALEALKPFEARQADGSAGDFAFGERLVRLPATRGNNLRLLVDGQETFERIFEAIHAARDYLLVQFFIVKDDCLGRRFRDLLVRRAQEGVRIYFLYDDMGSRKLPESYLESLRRAGVRVHPFKTTRGKGNRFQLNFRNHRKLVIADGRVALAGGLNVGDEYMGWERRFGHWRDTHLRIEGPAVQCLQIPFMEDYHWACGQIPTMNWQPRVSESDHVVMTMPTGPVSDLEVCSLMFLRAIHSAERRLWIASPYFVPDPTVVSALQLAALRGVEVRIMLPELCDHVLPYLSAFTYFPAMERAGVELYRYQDGFMHQKVLLVDDRLASVGSINADYRSFYLNFELAVMAVHEEFAGQVEAMLKRDFANCRRTGLFDYELKPLWFKVATRLARLVSPVQ